MVTRSLIGAEAILKLRASGDFESYWKYHEEQEVIRNHRSKFMGGKIPSPRLIVVRREV